MRVKVEEGKEGNTEVWKAGGKERLEVGWEEGRMEGRKEDRMVESTVTGKEALRRFLSCASPHYFFFFFFYIFLIDT